MELQHINVKLYLEDNRQLKPEDLVPVFHEWVQKQSCEELLIDVADYRHVHAGPGVVLVGHQADYSLDNAGNRFGVRYNRKAFVPGSNRDRFSQALASALRACQRLESDGRLEGRLRFGRKELSLFVNDRRLAPNVEDTRAALKAELREFLGGVLSSDLEMTSDTDPRSLCGVEVKVANPIEVQSVLRKLSTS